MDEKLYFTTNKDGNKVITVNIIDPDGDVHLYKMSKNAAKALEWYTETFDLGRIVEIIEEEDVEELDF